MTSASLPAQMLYVAAQFASADPSKQVLTGIFVRPAKDGGVKIDSTDGLRAFSVTCPDPIWHCDTPLLLNSRSFVKHIRYAKVVYVEADKDAACVLGGKNNAIDFMQGVSWRLQLDGFKGDLVAQYPDVDRLWPGKFSNSPGQPVGFTARLMAGFLKQVGRCSPTGIAKMELNGATDPFALTSTVTDYGLCNVDMRYLLSPYKLEPKPEP